MDNKYKNNEVREPEVLTEVDKIKDNSIATMHNKFIEARYQLTIEEQRILLILISLIQPDDEDFKDYHISVDILKELTGTKRKDIYSAIREAVERLLKRTIIIDTEEKFEAFNLISYGRYKRGEGYFVITIDKHLKPYLLQLKERFTSIPLKYIFPLRSVYSIRIYELLKQYENTGFRVDYLKDLREMLGIEEGEYKRFDNFERKVLKTAVKEINEKTDLEVSYEKKKTGRKITHIEFNVKKKKMLEGEKEKLKIAEPKKKQKEQVELVEAKEIKKEPVKSKVDKENTIWKNIYELRQKHQDLIEEILYSMKKERLTENQILFLIANVDSELVNSGFIKEAISSAVNNSKITNPMGFLIKTFNIDMKTAKFKELTLTSKKIDEKLFKEKLEDEFISAKPALALTKRYWKEEILPRNEKGEIDGFALDLLREPLKNAFYDDIDKIVYIPAPDEVYKDWFEGNYLEDIREFMKKNFGMKDVVVEVVDGE